MRTLFLTLVLTSVVLASNDSLFSGIYHITASVVLKTNDNKTAEKKLVSEINMMDGWLLSANLQEIRFRLPKDSIDILLSKVDSLGITTDTYYSRYDRSDEYLRLTASLQAKEYLLKQYFNILDSSGTEGIYAVSKEIADLQNNIEIIKGQLRAMIERMNFAEVKIQFNLNDRRVPLVSGTSDFDWLNDVNLPGLLEAFR